MEGAKEPDYRYHKVYLYVPGPAGEVSNERYGTAQVEIHGSKGTLSFVMEEQPASSGVKGELDVSVLLFNESTGDTVNIGRPRFDQSGYGNCSWEFKIGSVKSDKSEKGVDRPVNYRILAKVDPGSVEDSLRAWGGVLLEGFFTLEAEVRDSRIVGFKKEVKVKPAHHEAFKKNPLFQRVEPFEPPIPNSIWWRIGILPGYGGMWTTGFCPRERKYGTGF